MAIGYEFLRESLAPTAFGLRRPARVRPVSRVLDEGRVLAIPASVAPTSLAPLEHVLFALKHEGIQLQILAQALPHIGQPLMQAAIDAAPTSAYVRKACFLWEYFTQQVLQPSSPVAGAFTPLFDPARYVTGPIVRNSKWRVNFNGLGSMQYCATVERSPAVQAGIAANILGRTKAFVESLGTVLADRAIAWAYLHETQESFAIERETPSEDRARAFVSLLHQAHDKRPMSEDYLVELQASVVSNPFNRDVQFRTTQNWLRGPARGAAGVTYVPPEPEQCAALMSELMAFCNQQTGQIDPIVAAAIASFGLVYLHPFTDGNGRLSRFLFHHTLCRSGQLPNGLILPVSVSMKRHEAQYLNALQSYSHQSRALWSVQWIDEGQYAFRFNGHPSAYQYWDATDCVAFSFAMAEHALGIELEQETQFLANYDHLEKMLNARFDIRGNDLTTLVLSCLDQRGTLSKNRRKQFSGRVPENAFDYLEQYAKPLFTPQSEP